MNQITSKIDYPDKKFIDTFNTDEWEVETETGWADILSIGKTVKYTVYELILENGNNLKGADNHIIISYDINNDSLSETFLCELNIGDLVVTKSGLSKVKSIECLDFDDNMYDIEIDSDNHTFFTNDILSHNSLWLQNLTSHSVLNGNHSAYITCELQEELVHMRLGSNMLSINIDDYDEKIKDQDWLKQKLNKLKEDSFIPPGTLRVKEFPSGSASVNDIRAHLLKEQEILGIKFDNVFIDYINLIKNWRNPNSENLYIKIKQIAEDLRAMAMEEGWAVITVTQTNKGGWENENMSIINVSESAALIMTVDALFGIITSPEMKAKGEYMLKYMADRVSGMENTRKKFNVDFKLSRIEEDLNSQIEDLDYVINLAVGNNKADRGGMSHNSKSVDITVQTDASKIPELNVSGNDLFLGA